MRLPAWLAPLPDAERMRAIDRWAIEERGVLSLDLMERAGEGLARVVERAAPGGRVAVVCGKGNNGGDGLVAARVLREGGREVAVLGVGELSELRGDARANLDRLPGEPTTPFVAGALDGAAVIVDAILGTGFEGEPREPARSAIEAINAGGAPVIAADVPSGVDASTGAVAGSAVRASATATFHAAKPGLWIAPGKEHVGRVHVVEIGIPDGAPAEEEVDVGLIDPAVVGLLPRRGASSTKFSSGAVMVAGGSTGLTGAPCMASESAMRAGAGYVTALVPASLNLVFELRLLEAMTVALPDEDGALTEAAASEVLDHAVRADALVIGPGLGRRGASLAFARRVAREAKAPVVLDADGLNAHAGRLEDLAARCAPTVLTPHAGELGRLLGIDSEAVGARRLERAREAASRSQAVVVLKGDDTLVAEPGGRVAVSAGGSPALATAGTGDVLAGVVAAMLAQGLEPFAAAAAAVWVHGEAGRIAAREQGAPEGVVARDVIAALPAAIAAGRHAVHGGS
ncbi:MAG: NAD(P)H-hydrate dehydratase [Solirubrobacteraceae bacterium]